MHDQTSWQPLNARIGRMYEALPYDRPANPSLDLAPVLGIAALFGCAPEPQRPLDILDLGCGTGRQIERLASQTTGRLVGVDIATSCCETARRVCAAFGSRVHIVQSDFLDVDPDALGQFDVIYHTGCLYVVPPSVRAHVVDLAARCLKPGGALVLSYYAGSISALRAMMHRMLRTAVDPGPYQAMLAQARAWLKAIAEIRPGSPLIAQATQVTEGLPDDTFFHEVFNEAFDVMETSALETDFGARGIHFASYLGPWPFADLATARERAVAADRFDFCGGGYRHALFVKAESTAANPAARHLRWHSPLVRDGPDAPQGAIFRAPSLPVTFTVANAAARTALDAIAERGPLHWHELPQHDENLARDLLTLWRHGGLTPLWP